MGEKLVAILHNRATKIVISIIGSFFAALIIFMLGSWSANQTLKQNLTGYKNFTISQVISNELNKEGGVNKQLAAIKDIVEDTKKSVDASNDHMYTSWVIDINKYYNTIIQGKTQIYTIDYLTKISNYWSSLPDKYKTDVLTARYEFEFKWFSEHCK